MFLVTKGVIKYEEFHAIINNNGDDDGGGAGGAVDNESRAYNEVRKRSRALLSWDNGNTNANTNATTTNTNYSNMNIHTLIEMGLEYDVCRVTLALHGVSFYQECNRSSESGGLFPFMSMAASDQYGLCHVYDMVMKTCVQSIVPIEV